MTADKQDKLLSNMFSQMWKDNGYDDVPFEKGAPTDE